MRKILPSLLLLAFWLVAPPSALLAQSPTREVDVCIYGGTSAGVMAAYTAKQLGKSVLLIEPGRHVGGLSAGGLGYTDIGNKSAISGLALDFYRRIGQHYGTFEQWIFEPSVAEATFNGYLERAGVEVLYEHHLRNTVMRGKRIESITLQHSGDDPWTHPMPSVKAKVFLDCTYEGDMLAQAGVPFTIGRESNDLYGETYNGVQMLNKHQFPDGIDPYCVPGDPSSGLVWGISPATLAPQGTGNRQVQTYNYRICLTDDPANLIPITRPEGYDSTHYELLLRYLAAKPTESLWGFLKFDLMPNRKTDINNNGPFSTDMIGTNYHYPEADYAGRMAYKKELETYTKGLLYFIGHDERMAPKLREEMLKWGYPKDEYTDNGNWTWQPYVREGRRMIGAYVMTQANCVGDETVEDGVGMAAYTMDSHNCQRVVIEKDGKKMVKNEGDVQIGGFGPYPIAYRSIIPQAEHCENLLVPVALSASHIAYGSIRMEPVFMVLGQSAATAATLAIDRNTTVQRVDVATLQNLLRENPLADGSTPEILLDNESAAGITTSGDWTQDDKAGGRFGRSLLRDDNQGGARKSVRFTPEVKHAGLYDVYAYFPRIKDGSSQTRLVVADSKRKKKINLKADDIRVEGQTSGAWVPLGEFKLAAGKTNYVEISNQGADGVVVADAVLFVPKQP
ncbi:FAD dependent oxidoreductase [Catalinimonas alkaloidigena]|uniref:FAD dependent oxidoreductase n=1 Tax=Catalinimonas alkaloidigena TaxID=1075417 RepID=A0A1G9RET9_9BACT|nr:FAD-dependent oxidoreductase [Catalinimonas alkaloidigena]SDM21839.1 FAD dependent oxidoreductase [Catalinimonas alkaloidigena]